MSSNCTLYGAEAAAGVGRSKLFSGIFVAFSSLLCTGTIGLDIITSIFQQRRPWINCRWFSFNALTIGVLGYATSLTSEVHEPMPGHLDQLVKVSGILLICFAMNHAMPSLGVMDGGTLLTTMFPLFLLVCTTCYSLWVQTRNKLIDLFARDILIFAIFMVVVYFVLVSYALAVPTTKKVLDLQYNTRHRDMLKEVKDDASVDQLSSQKLKGYVQKYWLMAFTSSPDYTLQASGMSHAVALLCSDMLSCWMIHAPKRYFGNNTCYRMGSNYKGCVEAILVIHLVSIYMGYITAFFRPITSGAGRWVRNWSTFFRVESIMSQMPKDWKINPLPSDKKIMRIEYHAKNAAVDLMIGLQFCVVVFLCKIFFLFHVIAAWVLLFPIMYPIYKSGCLEGAEVEEDLSYYVLDLGWYEKNNLSAVAIEWKDYPEKWIRRGKEKTPLDLYNLLSMLSSPTNRGSMLGQLFLGSYETMSSDEVLRNCWSLHMITISCIIYASFEGVDDDGKQLKPMRKGANDGFRYAKLIDRNVTDPLKETRQAAKMVWERLTYKGTWLDTPLDSFAYARTVKDRIARLQEISRMVFVNEHERCNTLAKSSLKAIAAKSMFIITKAMLEFDGELSWEFEHMKEGLVHVLAACLTRNLPLAIFHQCSRGSFGKREEEVELAAKLLGETEEIRKYLEETRNDQMVEPNHLECPVNNFLDTEVEIAL